MINKNDHLHGDRYTPTIAYIKRNGCNLLRLQPFRLNFFQIVPFGNSPPLIATFFMLCLFIFIFIPLSRMLGWLQLCQRILLCCVL